MTISYDVVQRLKESLPLQPDNGQVELRILENGSELFIVAFEYAFGTWIVLNRVSE